MGSSPAGPLPRVGLFDRLLDRHRFPVLPPQERRVADAPDEAARVQAWLEAGRQWERAADREKDGKRRADYAAKADAARASAEAPAD